MEKEKNIQQQADKSLANFLEYTRLLIKKLNSKNGKTQDEAIEEIQNDPLEIATGKEFNGTKTYMILLGTGGPAMRITGELNEYDEPDTAIYQFQDWFTPWTDAYSEEEDTEEILLTYARQFYYAED